MINKIKIRYVLFSKKYYNLSSSTKLMLKYRVPIYDKPLINDYWIIYKLSKKPLTDKFKMFNIYDNKVFILS